jgi:zinc transport system ATP-binding protein
MPSWKGSPNQRKSCDPEITHPDAGLAPIQTLNPKAEVPALEFKNISFSYVPGKPVLEQASFVLNKGESICIVGPNGGGKSTLIKLALGLEQPEAGEILVFGARPETMRHRVGYMPQHINFDPQFPITVIDVVLMGRLGAGLGIGPFRKSDRAAAMVALEKVDLADISTCRFSELSGGQRQRTLIARSLVGNPDLLLLDEPTTNVDQTIERQFRETLRKLSAEMSIVLVSHDLSFVSGWLEHVLCVNRDVHMHPTASIDGKTLQEIFGRDIVAVRHDHDCPPGDHVHHHG